MLRVAVVTPWPVDDPRAWSGVIQPMLETVDEFAQVIPLSTRAVPDSVVDRGLARVMDGVLGRRYVVGHAVATSVRRGRALERRLEAAKPDVVLAVAASQDVAFLRGDWPVVQISDLTLSAARELYPDFQRMHSISRLQAQAVSRRSVKRTSHTLTATAWAKDRLVADDGIDPAKVTVAPFGPGIPLSPTDCRRPTNGPLRVLSVVSNWHRKGGDRIVAIHEELARRGIAHELTIVGDTPELPTAIRSVGRLHPQDIAGLYASHHVLLEPARGNASGITLTDAANWGLPAVATATGGVATIVKHGQTGYLIPEGDGMISRFADALVQAEETWQEMSAAAAEYAQTQLTWPRWGERAQEVLETVARQ